MACYGMRDLWEHGKEGRNECAVFCDCMGGNRRQVGEREEEGFHKEDPVGCDSESGKNEVFSYPLLLQRSSEGDGRAGGRMYL